MGVAGAAHDKPLVEEGLAERAAPELLNLDKAVVRERIHCPVDVAWAAPARLGVEMGAAITKAPAPEVGCLYLASRAKKFLAQGPRL